jgi:hypothetical protein
MSSPFRVLRVVAASAALVALANPLCAQNPQVAALKASLGANAAAQRGYAWTETTTLALNGEVKSTTVSNCQYAAGATKPTCTVTDAPPPPDKKRGIRGKVVENKTDEMKAYMDSVKALVGQYVPPKQELIAAAEGRGDVSTAPNPSAGTVRVTIANYLQQGDAVGITFSPATNLLSSAAVTSWLNDPKATVTLDVQFTTITTGVSFASKKVLTAAAKGIVITITGSNYVSVAGQ